MGVHVAVLERRARPTGTPPRCAVCGAVCHPSMLGPSYCAEHWPRLQGIDTSTRRAMFAAANAEKHRRREERRRAEDRRQSRELLALRVVAPGIGVAPLRERLAERRRAENGG